MARVAIVGGGPGGLLSAYLMARKYGGRSRTTLFEAEGRLGGKLHTRSFTSRPARYESGVAELYDYSREGDDPLLTLVGELGLATRPMKGQAVILNGTVLRDEQDIVGHCGQRTLSAIRDFRRRAVGLMPANRWRPDRWRFDPEHPWARRSAAELLDTVRDAAARRYLTVSSHADLATEPHLTNGLTGLKHLVKEIPGYLGVHALERGMTGLAERLVENTPGMEAVTDTRVASVERTRAGAWRLVSVHDGRARVDEFDAVILALPMSHLGSIEYLGEPLHHTMGEHVQRFDKPGHYLRVSLLFSAPFWRDRIEGSWFMVDAFGGACVYDESRRFDANGCGVLGFLIAGSHALDLANADEPTLVRRVLESLPHDLRARAEATLLEARVHRWCGGLSGLPGGLSARDPEALHQPDADVLPGLLLVGDYLIDSTLNGLYASADLVTTLLGGVLVRARPEGLRAERCVARPS